MSSEEEQTDIHCHIVCGYEGMGRYVEAARAKPEVDLGALFREHVIQPYWSDCAAGGELEQYAAQAVAKPIRNLDGLADSVVALRASGIERVVAEGFRYITAVLPGPDTTIWILAADPDNTFVRDFMHGVLGTVAGSGKIWLHLLPTDDLIKRIPRAIAHEHHHSIWLHRHFQGSESFTLLDYLILEGRASSFAQSLYPDVSAPWTAMLSTQQEAEQWQSMEGDLSSTSEEVMRKFMFGGIDGVPPLTGYTIGYHIVQAFLQKHPDVTVDEWTAMDVHQMLTESDYQGCSPTSKENGE